MNVDIVSRNLREISRLLDEIADEIKVQTAEPVWMRPEGEKKPISRIRTIPQAAREIKEKDPNTVITYQRLRRWVLDGKIKSFDGGKCRLVDLDEVERMVSGGKH